jgi:2-succinyl-5-enolpyruvyl-6-hydroxy-3-cyclohexene-1-carboxylate synthase
VSRRLPDPVNPSHALATVLVDELARCGIADVCIAPGSRSAALAMAFADDGRVRTHVGIDERSVGFLALGLARVERRPVAVLTTSGTATANLHPAVMEADASRVPLLVVTADRPPEARGAGANQTVDQVHLYGRAVRWAVDLGAAEDRPDANAYWRSTVCRAWSAAVGAGGPPGPVHLNVPFREPLVPERTDARGSTEGPFSHPIEGRPHGAPWTRVDVAGRSTPPGAASRLAERIDAATRGLLVAGDTDADPGPLVDLADRLAWPLLAEPLSGARSGNLSVASYDHLLAHADFASRHRPDLVVRVGRTNLSRGLLRLLEGDVPHVLLDRDAGWLDPTRSTDHLVTGDPAETLRRVAEGLDHRPRGAWASAWLDADAAAQEAIDRTLSASGTVTEQGAVRHLAASAADGALLVAGSSLPIRHLDRYMRPRTGLRVAGNRGASGIDGAVSTALGASRAHPGPTFAVLGDLTLLHDVNGLLCVEPEDDLVVVVLNNDGGGIFSLLPQAGYPEHFERLFGTPHDRDLGAIAAAYGCSHRRVDDPEDVLVDAADQPGVHIVEVANDRDDVAQLERRLRRAVHDALT